jgi:uncharacterized SAM-binding protein YcdF (DUF218 family)
MSKLAHLLEPLSLLWLLLLALPVLRWRRGQKASAKRWAVVALLYSLATCTCIGHNLVYSLERPWVRWEWASLPQSDVVLCLGGGIAPSAGEITGVDLNNSSDRVSTAVELIRQGKGKALVISGGMADAGETSESEATFKWIKNWGLVQAPVMPLGRCVNTRDEAIKMKELMAKQGWQTVTLVTSASHMRRAKATFEKAGVAVTPAACACQTDADEKERHYDKVGLPNPMALVRITEWIHEELGYLIYKLRGWV